MQGGIGKGWSGLTGSQSLAAVEAELPGYWRQRRGQEDFWD